MSGKKILEALGGGYDGNLCSAFALSVNEGYENFLEKVRKILLCNDTEESPLLKKGMDACIDPESLKEGYIRFLPTPKDL